MGVTLAAVADDGDFLAFDQVDIGVAIVINAHGSHPCSGQVLAAAVLLLEHVCLCLKHNETAHPVRSPPPPNPGLPGFGHFKFAGSGQARSRLGEGWGGGWCGESSMAPPAKEPRHPHP